MADWSALTSTVRLQRRFAVIVAGFDLIERRDDRRRIALQAFDAQRAEAHFGAAVEHHAQGGAVGVGVDRRLRIGQLRARVARLHHVAQQIALGRFPVALAKLLAFLQGPAGLEGVGVERLRGTFVRCACKPVEHQLDAANQHGFPRHHRDDGRQSVAAIVETRAHRRRVIAGRGDQRLDLVGRVPDEAAQLFAVDARIAPVVDEVEIVFQQRVQRRRRFDANLVLDRRIGRRRGDRDRRGRRGRLRSIGSRCIDSCCIDGRGDDRRRLRQGPAAGQQHRSEPHHHFFCHLCQNSWPHRYTGGSI